ncbi:carboxyl-terminal processing protease [Hydrogenispora ethanolica]|uniref:Carboxyl-terminal processing protease n=1 Tax=Hydrogenispora ethanolica TaxID=1082276 RepID=A0A4R1S006_HYDET|nr:carboxy terminal-processing peptidase [Hydrogenispora ethanolica]TCL72423.1 carboxyl-terminal processing protease [Hydrogenispora ethanolica]
MKKQLNRILILLLVVLIAGSAYTQALQKPGKEQVISDALLNSLETWHYSPQKLDDKLSQRVFDLYLKSLDPNKRFLLKSDMEQLKQFQNRIDDELRQGTHQFLTLSNVLLKRRIADIQGITNEILKQPFSFTGDETLEVDPDKREFCTSLGELKDLWRKTLKYQTLMRYIDLASPEEHGKKQLPANRAFQPELEAQAREYVAKSQKRAFDRLLDDTEERDNRFLDAVATSFDPHTSYFPPQTKANFDIQMSGTLEGIGAVLQEDGEYIKVVEVVPGSPAWRQKGLKANDLILKVAQGDNEPVDITYMPVDDVVKLVRGKKGTEVRLTVKKPNGQITVIPLIREVVVIEDTYAKSAVLTDSKTKQKFGYISLPSFYHDFNGGSRSSAEDVRRQVEQLKKEKVAGIILDLRNNGGGALDDAVKMSGLFIKSGPVVQVKDKNNRQVLKDPDSGVVYSGPLVVLVNSFSASASEILAAALQDYGRAVIVGGPTSFGKGTVQTFVDLDRLVSNDYAAFKPLGSLKLTVQKFYRITGASTQFKGVTADIPLPDPQSVLKVGEKHLDYPLPWDTIKGTSYRKWPKAPDLKSLKQNSAARVKNDPGFKLIADNIANLKEQQQNPQSLKLGKVLDEQAALRAESDKLKNLPGEKDLKVNGLRSQSGENDPDASQRAKEWHSQIAADVYVGESVNILKDMRK